MRLVFLTKRILRMRKTAFKGGAWDGLGVGFFPYFESGVGRGLLPVD
jgi:hypothetical protein